MPMVRQFRRSAPGPPRLYHFVAEELAYRDGATGEHDDLTGDAQAADAVRGRVDWKYLLGLELTDQGFDSSVLTFSQRPSWWFEACFRKPGSGGPNNLRCHCRAATAAARSSPARR